MKRRAALALAALLAGCVSGPSQRPRPAPAAAPAPGPETRYVVRPGDTLSGIAARSGVEMHALARANALAPPYLIRVGQRLAIPARRAAPRDESRAVVQPLPRPTPAPVARAPRLAWPTDGLVARGFGAKDERGGDGRGIGIAAHAGAAVRAAAGGTVLFAGAEPQRYGSLVLVDHGSGWVSAYGLLSRIVVREGETVRSGGRVGFVGEDGLHFELRRDNQPVDPLPLLPPRF
ncbi:MAG TPA: M23 family metallopeptidase [Novosphingobium sp.]|nr:M23 family metallopeptidase [Novosphingobium sp.]